MGAGTFRTLSEQERKYYQAVVNYVESYKTEWTFSNVPFDLITKVYRAVMNDHPEYFWLSSECRGTVRTCGNQSTLTVNPKFETLPGSLPDLRRRFDGSVNGLALTAKRHSPDLYEQILFLHDYIVTHTDYRMNASNCHNAFGCLIFRRAVCSGYAAAFQLLMTKLGVECGRVTGRSNSPADEDLPHVWNYVRLRDGYYFIDVTWDDPIVKSGSGEDNLSHDFFCVGLDEMKITHRFDPDQFIPSACGTKYDYFTYRGWRLDKYLFPSARDIAAKQLRQSDRFFLKFGSKLAADAAKRDLIDSKKAFSIPGMSRSIAYGLSKSGLILNVRKNAQR